jgi:hypothetical protein
MKLDRIPKNLSMNLNKISTNSNKISMYLNNYLCWGSLLWKTIV